MTVIQREIVNQIIQGDCLNVLPSLPENCVDCLVTDPPYGYSFMGKDWDKNVPSVEVWRECLRVLKPGAFAFIMSGARADVFSQNIIRLNTAGFRTAFTPILWSFSTGFPKSLNISKAVLRRITNELKVKYNLTEVEWEYE